MYELKGISKSQYTYIHVFMRIVQYMHLFNNCKVSYIFYLYRKLKAEGRGQILDVFSFLKIRDAGASATRIFNYGPAITTRERESVSD